MSKKLKKCGKFQDIDILMPRTDCPKCGSEGKVCENPDCPNDKENKDGQTNQNQRTN